MASQKYQEDSTIERGGDPTQVGQGVVSCKRKQGNEIAIVRCISNQSVDLCEGCRFHITLEMLQFPDLLHYYPFTQDCKENGHLRVDNSSDLCGFCFIQSMLAPPGAMSDKIVEAARKEGHQTKRKQQKPVQTPLVDQLLREQAAKESESMENTDEDKKDVDKDLDKLMEQESDKERDVEVDYPEAHSDLASSISDEEMTLRLDSLANELDKCRQEYLAYRVNFDDLDNRTQRVAEENRSLLGEIHLTDGLLSAAKEYSDSRIATLEREKKTLQARIFDLERRLQNTQDSSLSAMQTLPESSDNCRHWASWAYHVLILLVKSKLNLQDIDKSAPFPFDDQFLLWLIEQYPGL